MYVEQPRTWATLKIERHACCDLTFALSFFFCKIVFKAIEGQKKVFVGIKQMSLHLLVQATCLNHPAQVPGWWEGISDLILLSNYFFCLLVSGDVIKT